ncbi:MAG TPA: LarC family nickel insertion protein, partial [Polyangiaceae bacterium]|nr:LarC family nickel insertion protein [Polyangiaceae bacterium]
NCLVGVPTYDAGMVGELVTPTGAAIVATVTKGFVRWPEFTPERVGWGAGTRVLADRPNALRVALGTRRVSPASLSHVLVEATVDDMTGELMGHALACLLQAGAVDAWISPVTMKKGRPGWIVTALARSAEASAVADAMLLHTSTIGVRFTEVARRELSRRTVEVPTEYGAIAVKVSGGGSEPLKLKPEFEVCARIARERGIPVRAVLDATLAAARALVGTL